MSIGRGALLRGTIGVAISVAAVWILVHSVDVGTALQVLGRASPLWIAVMLVTAVLDISSRGARWRALLAPIAPLPYLRVLGYTYIGYLANNVLPARLGELYRSHALGEGEGVSRTTVLGTVVVERVVDTVMVVAIAALAVLVLSASGVMGNAVLLGFAFVTVLVIVLALGMAAHRLPGASRATAVVERWPRVLELARRLRQGLAVAGRPRTIAVALAFSALAWAASIATFLAAGQAVGVQLSLAQAALVTSGVALVTIVPAGPGFVGTFELTVVEIAAGFGVPRDAAFALGLLIHAMILGTTSVGGVIALLARRRRDAIATVERATTLAAGGGGEAPPDRFEPVDQPGQTRRA
jgi:uncharacterized protein (TIRG00374 family)